MKLIIRGFKAALCPYSFLASVEGKEEEDDKDDTEDGEELGFLQRNQWHHMDVARQGCYGVHLLSYLACIAVKSPYISS